MLCHSLGLSRRLGCGPNSNLMTFVALRKLLSFSGALSPSLQSEHFKIQSVSELPDILILLQLISFRKIEHFLSHKQIITPFYFIYGPTDA